MFSHVKSLVTWHFTIFKLDQEHMCRLYLLRFSCVYKSLLADVRSLMVRQHTSSTPAAANSVPKPTLHVQFSNLLAELQWSQTVTEEVFKSGLAL